MDIKLSEMGSQCWVNDHWYRNMKLDEFKSLGCWFNNSYSATSPNCPLSMNMIAKSKIMNNEPLGSLINVQNGVSVSIWKIIPCCLQASY